MSERFISYSINGEDIILRRIFGEQAQGFYVDVGAAHPTLDNDTRALYDRGWSGINVEPNASFFAELAMERPRDRNIPAALADEEGLLTYWRIDGTGLSTCDAEEAERARQKGRLLVEQQIPVTTLGRILSEAGVSDIDLLKVDVEGLEYRVLQGNDWTRFRPRLVLVEVTIPETPERRTDRIRPFLEQNGYDFAYFDGLNDFFLERGFAPPADCFRPISVFDEADRYELANLRQHANNLEHATHTKDEYIQHLQVERSKSELEMSSLQARLAETETNAAAAGAALEIARTHAADRERDNISLGNQLYQARQRTRGLEAQGNRSRNQMKLMLKQLRDAGEQLLELQHELTRAKRMPTASAAVSAREIAGLQGELREASRLLAATQAVRASEVAELQGELREASRLLAATQAMKASEFAELKSELQESSRLLAASRARSASEEAAELQRELQEALRLLAATRASTSWRVTRPIRTIARLFRERIRGLNGVA